MIDERLHDLVDRWEQARDSGETVSIDELCTDCPELREELDSLIRRLIAFDDFTDNAPAESDDCRSFDAGRYHVRRKVAAGGIGEIYEATDTELQRDVAVKLLQSRWLRSGETRKRFEMEAEITARLQHPGIVPVYGFGKDPHGAPYYAMRYVGGQDLDRVIETFHKETAADGRSAFESERFQNLLLSFLKVCEAVGYAHSRHVVHRDIKPANIRVGEHGEAILLDWGLAKPLEDDATDGESTALQPASAEEIQHTSAGSLKGSPIYMSPEQAVGEPAAIREASDIYSLGATLYFLITGVRPFSGRNLGEFRAKVIDGQFTAPAVVRPDVPKPLEAICLKAMQKKPADRFANVGELANDVKQFLGDKPVAAWREPWTERLRRWMKKHRTVVMSSAAALIVAVIALGVLGFQESRANTLLSGKNEELNDALTAEEKARKRADANAADAIRRKTEAETARENTLRESALHSIALADRYFADGKLDRSFLALQSCPEKYRSPEWHLLDRMHHTATRTIPVSGSNTGAIAVNAKRKLIAAADSNGDVHCYDTDNWKRTLFIKRSVDGKSQSQLEVRCLAFPEDGSALAVGCGDGRIEFWDISNKKPAMISDRLRMERPLATLTIAGKNLVILATDIDGHAFAWDVSQKNPKLVDYKGFKEQIKRDLFRWSGLPVLPLAGTLTRDGRLAVTVGGNELRIWDVKTGKDLTFYHPLQLDDFPAALTTDLIKLTAVAVSPDMQKIIVGDENGTIRLYYMDLAKAKGTRNERNGPFLFRAHQGAVKSLSFSPDGQNFISTGEDRTIAVCESAFLKRVLRTLRAHDDSISGAVFLPDGEQFVSAGSTRINRRGELADPRGECKVWEANAGHGYVSLSFPIAAVTPDGKRAVYSTTNSVHVLDAVTGKRLATLAIPAPKSTAPKVKKKSTFSNLPTANRADEIAFNAGGDVLAILRRQEILWTNFDAATPKADWKTSRLPSNFNRLLRPSLIVSPDGQWIALLTRKSSRDRDASSILCVDVAAGNVNEIKLKDWAPETIAYTPDSTRLLAGGHRSSGKGRAVLWNLTDRRVITDYDGWNLAVFSPDGRRLALADGRSSDVAKVEIRDIATGTVVSTNSVVIRNPGGMRLSRDAGRLVIWSRGANAFHPGKISLLQTATGRHLLELPRMRDTVDDVRFLSDHNGFRLVTRHGLETRFWSVTPR